MGSLGLGLLRRKCCTSAVHLMLRTLQHAVTTALLTKHSHCSSPSHSSVHLSWLWNRRDNPKVAARRPHAGVSEDHIALHQRTRLQHAVDTELALVIQFGSKTTMETLRISRNTSSCRHTRWPLHATEIPRAGSRSPARASGRPQSLIID